MDKKIENGNRLIAEFVGWHKSPYPNTKNSMYRVDDNIGEIGIHISVFKFHSSWNELMPVVEKIEKEFDGFVIIHNSKCVINPNNIVTLGETKIEATYKAVVYFITWHNQQTKNRDNNKKNKRI